MREQFEKLPEIESALNDAEWSEITGRYVAKRVNHYMAATFLNGAWYAFQEQQNQLDLINQYTAAQGASIKILNDERIKQQKKIDAVLQYLDTGDHPLDFSANTIRDLLK